MTYFGVVMSPALWNVAVSVLFIGTVEASANAELTSCSKTACKDLLQTIIQSAETINKSLTVLIH